ncbi:MAG TPA: mechanosensitive ion channel domain-containing protein [Acidobacteriaceae bacterium]|nr:mechanosensitive ion channel domain-containing protein [Acidobacteriaceae bacterium]
MKRRWAAWGLACLLLCCIPLLSHAKADQQAEASGAKPVAQAPVVVDGKTLFTVRGILSFTAQARAQAISQRIKDLSEEVSFKRESISVSDSANTSDIVAGDTVLMTVTNQDAELAGEGRHALAVEYAQKISNRLESLRRKYSIKSIILGSIYALIATGVLILIFKLLALLFPKLYRRLYAWRGTYIPSLRIQRFELLPAERIAGLLVVVAKLIRLIATLNVLYLYASLVLGFFPWTRGYSRTLVGYVVSPLKVIDDTVLTYLPNLFYIAVIVTVAVYVTKFIRIIFREIGRGTITFENFHPEWAEPTYKIARFVILAVTAIAVFPYLPGSKSPAFRGISIFLGVLFSLGSTSAVANVVAGVILTYMRAFRLGDRVQIADTVGDVIESSLLVTRIRTIKNVEITIANSMVLSSHIINFSGSIHPDGLILHTTVTIGYDAPWRRVHELLMGAALATENILETPQPFVLQTALDDFYVHYQINAYTNKPSLMQQTYSYLHQNIQDKFYEAGVEIMSPHATMVRDGNRVAIPDDYLPKDYRAPRFRVQVEKSAGGGGGTNSHTPE